MRTPRRDQPRPMRHPKKEQGAVMIVVMLVLLAATASAVFAVHTTSYELRASGFQRQSMQSKYGAEAALSSVFGYVNATDPRLLESLPVTGQCGAEPSLPTGQTGHLFELFMVENQEGAPPIDRESIGGTRQVYTPDFFVCAYDDHLDPTPQAGSSATGGSVAQKRHRVTFTAYSKLNLDLAGNDTSNGDVASTVGEDEEEYADTASDTNWQRNYHEVVNVARAHALTEPY